MRPCLSANYVSGCPPNMAQGSVWVDNLQSVHRQLPVGNLRYPYPPTRTLHAPSLSQFLPWKARQSSQHGTSG